MFMAQLFVNVVHLWLMNGERIILLLRKPLIMKARFKKVTASMQIRKKPDKAV